MVTSHIHAHVFFRKKSSLQKDDCICGCNRPAILEAVYFDQIHTPASVRCSDWEACKLSAARIAVETGSRFRIPAQKSQT